VRARDRQPGDVGGDSRARFRAAVAGRAGRIHLGLRTLTGASAPQETPPMNNILETAKAAGNFKTLAKAIDAAGLAGTLNGAGPYTVFAPTDEAFAKIPKDQLDALLKDTVKLKEVLLYHVVPGKVRSADVQKMQDGAKIHTAANKDFTLGLKSGKVKVNRAEVIKADIEASNGIIHVLDEVVIPS
jgi:uncharacterized surface protein with fasciclin (FAS1) repeats